MARREPGQELARRAGERVDGLVFVADDAQVAAIARPQLQQALLHRVRVLVFVHAEPALPGVDGRGGLRVGLEDVDGPGQQVVEVHPPGPGLGALVAGEDADEQVERDRWLARRRRRAPGHGRGIGRRGQAPALGPFDLVGQVLRRREPVVAGQASGERHEQRQLRVEQVGQRRAIVLEGPEVAELAQRVGVERAGRDARQAERRRRSTISPAALSVKVTMRIWSGVTTSVATA